jgi:phosphoserine aminotransferase
VLDYVVTGSWSSKAYSEAQRLSAASATTPAFANVRLAATTKPSSFTTLPKRDEYSFTKDAGLVYYCENETINGIEYPLDQSSPYAFPFDLVPDNVPLVADYSSSFLSRPIPNLERHAIIYAGAQKNLGPSGVTVVIVRNDLLVDTAEAMKLGGVPVVPIQNEYKILADNGSLYNTPPTFPIYVSALVLEHLLSRGGLDGLRDINGEKARLLYETLDAAERDGKVRCVVREKEARSWMNVTFETVGEGKEKVFLDGAESRGFRQLKGHRSVGGERGDRDRSLRKVFALRCTTPSRSTRSRRCASGSRRSRADQAGQGFLEHGMVCCRRQARVRRVDDRRSPPIYGSRAPMHIT